MPTLILIRGLPGSGKSTLARSFCGFVHCEADQYFYTEDGTYLFDAKQLPAAHTACLNKAAAALAAGSNVVVANTFSRLREMAPYQQLAKLHNAQLHIITASGHWQSIHNVPQATIDAMRERWED